MAENISVDANKYRCMSFIETLVKITFPLNYLLIYALGIGIFLCHCKNQPGLPHFYTSCLVEI